MGRRCRYWPSPHVIQGFEEYNGKYIVFSLGNFCFGANKNPDDKDSMIFQQTFTFTKSEKNGTEEIVLTEYGQAKIIPCSISSVGNRNDFCPTPKTGEAGQRIIDRVNKYSNDYGVKVDANGVLSKME